MLTGTSEINISRSVCVCACVCVKTENAPDIQNLHFHVVLTTCTFVYVFQAQDRICHHMHGDLEAKVAVIAPAREAVATTLHEEEVSIGVFSLGRQH